jgi:hypothetical protein
MPSFRFLASAGPALALALALCGAPAVASAQTFNDAQRGEIQKIIKDYLITHPEILEEVSAELTKRQAQAEAEKHQAAIAANANTIFNSPRGVVVGNKDGDVTFVEFFDYNCGYCKRAMDDMVGIMKNDPKLKVVLKEFPVLGPGSVEAAQVAVAVRMQDPTGKKYLDFHQKLLSGPRPGRQGPRLGSGQGSRSRRRQTGKGHGQPGSARDHRRELQARGIHGHERHAELRHRQAGDHRCRRRRRAEGEDQPGPLRQGTLFVNPDTARVIHTVARADANISEI